MNKKSKKAADQSGPPCQIRGQRFIGGSSRPLYGNGRGGIPGIGSVVFPAGSAIFDGLDGAAIDTGHAVRTLLAPRRTPVYHRDGTKGAAAFAFAAGGAGI